MTKGEKVKLAISLGVDVETAIALFDEVERVELPKAQTAKKERNAAYYQDHKPELKEKREKRNVQKISAVSAPIQSIKPVQPHVKHGYFARIGTRQHEAWNTWWHDTKGRGMPADKKGEGWYVASEWPPTMMRAAR